MKDTNANKEHKENRDPITDEKGAHPVGVGVGTAVGGAAGGAAGAAAAMAATGAAAGSVAGPVGTVVGVVAGGIIGAVVGKQVAENVNPTEEDAYWRGNYSSRPYIDKGARYEDYQPAYQYGWESRSRSQGRGFEDMESELRTGWEGNKPRLGWDKARPAVRDAWDRIDTRQSTSSTAQPSAPPKM